MSRPLRIEYPDAWYHVMNRGRRGESIFSDKNDYVTFIDLLREASELWDVRVSAFCLMTNHYHILIQTPQGNLSRFMRHLNGVYTQRFNRSHRFDGQLFRGRFKSILVEEDRYLLELMRYIHRNPLRADMVASLADYPWSSHHGYLTSSKAWHWLHNEFILSMLSDHKNSRKAYLQFMDIEDRQELLGIFESKKWPSLLGGDKFIDWVKETFFKRKMNRQVPDSLQLAPERYHIIKEVCRAYRVDEKDILISQRGKSNEPRNVAIYLCRMLRNDTLIDIGRIFGMTGYSPAASAVERVKKKLLNNKDLQNRISKIQESAIAIIAKKGQDET